MNDQQGKKTQEHPLSGDSAALPNERDEHPSAPKENEQHRQNRGVTEQGRRDVEAGVQDTERIGVPTALPSGEGGKA